tara:strand:+ start:302 stop:874 length:573 start_codon:yes stop_codon:yes gene_type:complete
MGVGVFAFALAKSAVLDFECGEVWHGADDGHAIASGGSHRHSTACDGIRINSPMRQVRRYAFDILSMFILRKRQVADIFRIARANAMQAIECGADITLSADDTGDVHSACCGLQITHLPPDRDNWQWRALFELRGANAVGDDDGWSAGQLSIFSIDMPGLPVALEALHLGVAAQFYVRMLEIGVAKFSRA